MLIMQMIAFFFPTPSISMMVCDRFSIFEKLQLHAVEDSVGTSMMMFFLFHHLLLLHYKVHFALP